MVSAIIQSLAIFFNDWMDYIPPGLLICIASAFIADRKYLEVFRQEFVGTLIMIICTFSAGKWVGANDVTTAWTSHFFGVIAADYIGGGPHVNPGITMSMWCLGKCNYTEAYVRIAGTMGGGLIAFPLFHALSNALKLEPFGGPEFSLADNEDHPVAAFFSETVSTILLCFAIYILNWELHFGTFNYIIKQGLTAIAIRALIEFFPTAGPAINPMLATAWDVFGVGNTYEFPDDMGHYFVYWVGPWIGAIIASITYAIYSGDEIFGMKLPVGPFKKVKAESAKKDD